MSFTGVDSLDRSIAKANAWMADIDKEFGADNRQLAYRVARAWPGCIACGTASRYRSPRNCRSYCAVFSTTAGIPAMFR